MEGKKRQKLIDNSHEKENTMHSKQYNVIRYKVLIINEDVGYKARDKHNASFPIVQILMKGTMNFQCGTAHINIKRLAPN